MNFTYISYVNPTVFGITKSDTMYVLPEFQRNIEPIFLWIHVGDIVRNSDDIFFGN